MSVTRVVALSVAGCGCACTLDCTSHLVRGAPMQISVDSANRGIAARSLESPFSHTDYGGFQFIFCGRFCGQPLEVVFVPFQSCGGHIREVLPFADELLAALDSDADCMVATIAARPACPPRLHRQRL